MGTVLVEEDGDLYLIDHDDLYDDGEDLEVTTVIPSIKSSKMRDDESETVSLWLEEKGVYTPATALTITHNLPAGMYKMSVNGRTGDYQCVKLDLVSDELFFLPNNNVIKLLEEIKLFWQKKDLYKEKNLIHKRGIMLEGFAGTGKSSIVSLLSLEVIKEGGVVFKIDSLNNFFYYINFIKHSFRKIQPDTPVLTIIEDLELYAENAHSEMLDFLDGKNNINNHVVVATSNNLSKIPDAFLRPSRIDYRIEVPLTTPEVREAYFKNIGIPEEDIPNLVEHTEDFTLSELKEVYISIYILGKDVTESCNVIKHPKDKIDYSERRSAGQPLGF